MKISTVSGIAAYSQVIKLVEGAYRQIGYEIEVTILPARRALLASSMGDEFDAELGRTAEIENEFPDLLRVPVVIETITASAFALTKNADSLNKKGLTHYHSSTVRGFRIIEMMISEFEHTLVNDAYQGMELLKSGRVDLLILPKRLGLSEMALNRHKGISIVNNPIYEAEMYHYIHRKHSHLLPALTRAFETLIEKQAQP